MNAIENNVNTIANSELIQKVVGKIHPINLQGSPLAIISNLIIGIIREIGEFFSVIVFRSKEGLEQRDMREKLRNLMVQINSFEFRHNINGACKEQLKKSVKAFSLRVKTLKPSLTQNNVASLFQETLAALATIPRSPFEFLTKDTFESRRTVKLLKEEVDVLLGIPSPYIQLKTVVKTAIKTILIAVLFEIVILYQIGALNEISLRDQTKCLQESISYAKSFTSTSACVSYHGEPQTVEEAKKIFLCHNAWYQWTDNSKDWKETQKTFRAMTRLLHPDTKGSTILQRSVNKANDILKRALNTKDGKRNAKNV